MVYYFSRGKPIIIGEPRYFDDWIGYHVGYLGRIDYVFEKLCCKGGMDYWWLGDGSAVTFPNNLFFIVVASPSV